MPDFELTDPRGKRFIVTAPDGTTQEEAMAYAQSQFSEPPPMPTMGQVARNAVPKAVANLVNTPQTVADLVGKGLASLPFAGHFPALKKLGEPEPNYPMQFAEKIGAVDPAMNPQTGPQRVLDTAVQSGVSTALAPFSGVPGLLKNMAVGATSGAAAQTTKELTGSDLLAVAVGLATPFALSGLGREKTTLNPVKRSTLEAAQDAGYVVQPSTVKPTFTSNKLESIAGKAAVVQDASLRNQETTNRLAAKAIGIADDSPLTPELLADVREQAAQPYREIAELSPRAKSALEKLKEARFEAKEQWNYYKRTGKPEAGKEARFWDTRSEQYERVIENEANKIVNIYGVKPGTASTPSAQPVQTGRAPLPASAQLETRAMTEQNAGLPGAPISQPSAQPAGMTLDAELLGQRTAGASDLMARLKASRQLIARTYDVERALGIGDGNVSAPAIARMLKSGKPLTGELRVIGQFAQAFPRMAREAAHVPPPSVSGTDAASSALLGTMGYGAAGGPVGLLAAGLPLMRTPARNLVLSKGYQSGLLKAPVPIGQTMTRAGLAASPLINTILQPAPR